MPQYFSPNQTLCPRCTILGTASSRLSSVGISSNSFTVTDVPLLQRNRMLPRPIALMTAPSPTQTWTASLDFSYSKKPSLAGVICDQAPMYNNHPTFDPFWTVNAISFPSLLVADRHSNCLCPILLQPWHFPRNGCFCFQISFAPLCWRTTRPRPC